MILKFSVAEFRKNTEQTMSESGGGDETAGKKSDR